MSVRRRTSCRLCDGTRLTLVLSLAPTPPANAFLRADELGRPEPRYPLDMHLCEDCGHLQLLDVVDPAELFAHYVYVSGTSPVFVRHFTDYAERLVSRFGLAAGDLAVDIGSNDGTLLAAFRSRGLAVQGIDPAIEIAADASARGLPTLTGFFDLETAGQIRAERGPAAVITANNVFAHIDDLAGVVAGVAGLLRPGGVFCFEVSYFVDVYQQTLFDTIYHEHLDYHTVAPLERFFAAHGLHLFAAERVGTHGGSLRGYVQAAGGRHAEDGSVARLAGLERTLGLDRAETLQRFEARIRELGGRLRALLHERRSAGRRIAGFGAPAKATTLMHEFRLDGDLLDFIADDSPLKQGLYTPGLHVPVLPGKAIYQRRPDDLLLLAWNFAAPIMRNHAAFREAGGRFIVPLPDIRIV